MIADFWARSKAAAIAFAALAAPLTLAQQPSIAQPIEAPKSVEWQTVESTTAYDHLRTTFHSLVPSGFPENEAVPVDLFVPKNVQAPIPVALVLHYWGAPDTKVERRLIGKLLDRGIAGILMPLPYHISRAPHGTNSGELAVTPDVDQIKTTMTQGVLDARMALAVADTQPALHGGDWAVAGISLGALVAEATAGAEPRIKTCAFVFGGADLAGILWHSSRVIPQREKLKAAGWTEDTLRNSLEPIEPTRYLSERKDLRAIVFGGRYDTIIPPPSVQKLAGVLKTNDVVWLDCGHFGLVYAMQPVFNETADFLSASLLGHTYTAHPLSIPTVRLSAILSSKGFDLGAGLDLVSPGGTTGIGLSLLATPRGPSLVLSKGVYEGFQIGISYRPNVVIVGVVWSTAL